MATGTSDRLAFWLYRPYFDLGPPAPRPPIHVTAIEYAFNSIVAERDCPRLPGDLGRSFRPALIDQCREPRYRIALPGDLDPQLRSPRWVLLCQWVDSYADLAPMQKVRLNWLLVKLCLYDASEELTRSNPLGLQLEHESGLAFLRSWALFRRNLDDSSLPYSILEFERIATSAAPGYFKVEAHYQLVMQYAKFHADRVAAERWQARHLAAINEMSADLDEYQHLWFMSRYHRVGGFIPQMRRDSVGVTTEMRLAEEYARQMPRSTNETKVAADTALFAVLESRFKEALWLTDMDSALRYVDEITELMPHDPRAWMHSGEAHLKVKKYDKAIHAYQTAARYSPPGREISLYKAGQCFERIGDPERAAAAYLDSLDIEPFGISSAKALLALGKSVTGASVNAWAGELTEQLSRIDQSVPRVDRRPYQSFAPPITGSR